MHKIEATSPEAKSANVPADKLAQLKALFPELITEGPNGAAVDLNVLKALVGDATVTDMEEKFGLNWHGRRVARQLAFAPSMGTLRPRPDESVNWETTGNLFIEGDNLEVLKLLQKSYAGQVKLIYIDPPYNTGQDFIYPDSFKDSLRNYLELTCQVEGGLRISSNSEAGGRFHTDWLNMIYPRLILARGLLAAEGVLLVSIGDEEIHNLRSVCDLVLGAENFCGTFIWEKKKKPSFLDRNMGSVTEYVVAYAKNREFSPPFVAGKVEDGKKYPFNNAGNSLGVLTFPPRAVRFTCPDQLISAQDMSEGNIRTRLLDDMQVLNGTNACAFRLEGEWRYSQAKLDEYVAANAEILISKIPFRPNYVNRSGDVKKTANLLSHRVNGIPTNEDATAEIREIFSADVMSYPKPTGLIRHLVQAITGNGDLVMDFFAGSGTTGVATMLQCCEDGKSRRFLLVQLPEPLDPSHPEQEAAARLCQELGRPALLSEVCKERLRRDGRRLGAGKLPNAVDTGFRVLALDTSNVRAWRSSGADLVADLLADADHTLPDRSELDLHFEALLKYGLDLCTPSVERVIAGKTVRAVGGGVLFTCLVDNLSHGNVEALAEGMTKWREALMPHGDVTCLFRDSAFEDDVTKVNLEMALQQGGFTHVRSI